MAEAFIVAFDIQEEGTGGTASTHAKKGTVLKKGEIPAGSLEMVAGAYLGVNGSKLCQIEAESAEEACKIAGEAYGNRGGVAGACKKTNWTFASA